ncbi:MAG: S8 family serine peptidase [Acidobacteria bacterium]|nr:S8 family serine peptidase [Acidobacteriota bacterium]
MKRLVGSLAVAALLCGVLTATTSGQSRRAVLIRTAQPYDAVVQAIERAGGTVTHRFKFVQGLAAEVPESALREIERLVGADNVGRDDIIPLPVVDDPKGGSVEAVVEAEDLVALDAPGGAGEVPANYAFNVLHTNVAPLHAAGYTGDGIVIAVIDTGYRPIIQHVAPGRLISPGINLVPGATEPPAIDNANGSHGTFVAGMAAANIAFCFSTANRFVVVAEHYGAAAPSPFCAATSRLIPMVGSAPGASIFPIKIFPAAGGGSPTSRTIAAMEAAIELRQKYDAGMADGLNIQIANLSLGGPTSAAARTLSDQTVEAMINADIVPVISAGNDGFSAVTGGSPGTSFAALTVGAASGVEHEQIFRAQFSVPCNTAPLASVLACAQAWRPDTNVQISEFSSRGPTHDGRVDPDVVAYGSNNFSQGSGGATTVNFGSGTSFSAPTVSGIAAALRQAVPGATARQVRNAILMSANPAVVPTAAPNDQGAGFVDAAAALALLQGGMVPDTYATAHFTRNLQANMARAGVPVHGSSVSRSFTGVRPAEVTDVPILVPANAETLYVRLYDVTAALPPDQQNPFFTDDVFIRVQSSAVHRRDRRVAGDFVPAGAERLYTFTRPEAGVWRITPTGDWTNAGTVSYKVAAWVTQEPWPQHTAKAKINFGDIHTYQLVVPAGTTTLETRLTWMNMNGHYPISDIDVILTSPGGMVVNSCNTGRAPELCAVADPEPGTWTATVVGFSVSTFGTPGGREDYTLRVAADGMVLRPRR